MRTRITAILVALLLIPSAAFSQNSLKKFTDALNALGKPGGQAANSLIVNGGFEEPGVQAGGYSVVNAQVDVTSATSLLHAEIEHNPSLPFNGADPAERRPGLRAER